MPPPGNNCNKSRYAIKDEIYHVHSHSDLGIRTRFSSKRKLYSYNLQTQKKIIYKKKEKRSRKATICLPKWENSKEEEEHGDEEEKLNDSLNNFMD